MDFSIILLTIMVVLQAFNSIFLLLILLRMNYEKPVEAKGEVIKRKKSMLAETHY